MTWSHVVVTIFVLLVLLTANIWYDQLIPPTKRDFVSFETFEKDRERAAKIILPFVILFFAGQLAFVVSIIGGLTKKLWRTR